jgi:hypothetical protein
MEARRVAALLPALLLLVACGGSTPEPQTADDLDPIDEPPPAARRVEPAAEDDAPDADEEPARGAAAAPEPDFPENASVDEAIAAVPRDMDRLNVDPERLAEPLQNPEVYEPCKPGNQRFDLRVAIWNGRAVGVDVQTKNAKLADCLRERIREVQWPDRVRSLNTIEFGM